jgi:hypothetical protein
VFALNARYNIGPVVRNFNDPMLALLPLHEARRRRFSFSQRPAPSETSSDGAVLLTFEERDRPTIVRDTGGRPVFARGDLLVQPATGVVSRTRIAFTHDGVDRGTDDDVHVRAAARPLGAVRLRRALLVEPRWSHARDDVRVAVFELPAIRGHGPVAVARVIPAGVAGAAPCPPDSSSISS